MSGLEPINVEVAYARLDEQVIIPIKVAVGSTAEQAIQASRILERFQDIDLEANKIGIFGRIVDLHTVLREGDRVEIYRPLSTDPKESRRRRAQR